jgi:hypothetical protein
MNVPVGYSTMPTVLKDVEAALLIRQNALSVISRHLRLELLANFLTYFHPTWPILTKQDISSLAEPQHWESDRLSLLLLHAICFIGADTANRDLLLAEGFDSRQSAHATYLARALVSCLPI